MYLVARTTQRHVKGHCHVTSLRSVKQLLSPSWGITKGTLQLTTQGISMQNAWLPRTSKKTPRGNGFSQFRSTFWLNL